MRDVVWAFFKLGWLAFGGPVAQVGLMHREVVERKRWLSEEEFVQALNFCHVLPGPEALQLGIYLGWRRRRRRRRRRYAPGPAGASAAGAAIDDELAPRSAAAAAASLAASAAASCSTCCSFLSAPQFAPPAPPLATSLLRAPPVRAAARSTAPTTRASPAARARVALKDALTFLVDALRAAGRPPSVSEPAARARARTT